MVFVKTSGLKELSFRKKWGATKAEVKEVIDEGNAKLMALRNP